MVFFSIKMGSFLHTVVLYREYDVPHVGLDVFQPATLPHCAGQCAVVCVCPSLNFTSPGSPYVYPQQRVGKGVRIFAVRLV